jgi:hypothetical protein
MIAEMTAVELEMEVVQIKVVAASIELEIAAHVEVASIEKMASVGTRVEMVHVAAKVATFLVLVLAKFLANFAYQHAVLHE